MDQRNEFKVVFNELCEAIGITIWPESIRYPHSNSLAEWENNETKSEIRKYTAFNEGSGMNGYQRY